MRSHLRSPDDDELVDHDLGAVDEVAELAFPQGQGVRIGQRVAVFETQHRLFRQGRIDALVQGLAVADVVEREVAALRCVWSTKAEWRCEKVPRIES